MLKTSSDSAVAKLPAHDIMIQELRHISESMAKKYEEIEEIILFGSLARGDYGVDSDADILVIISSSHYDRFFDRIPKYVTDFLDFCMPVDVFPYTRKEIDIMKGKESLFIRSMLDECIVLSKK